MEYRSGQLTISAEDVSHLIDVAWHSVKQRVIAVRSKIVFRVGYRKHDSRLYLDMAVQELRTARTLLSQGQIRAAGVVAGVAMVLHLKHVAVAHNVSVPQYASIALLQDALHIAGIVQPQHRKLLKRCSAIRNQCVHARKEIPSRKSVEKLIANIDELRRVLP